MAIFGILLGFGLLFLKIYGTTASPMDVADIVEGLGFSQQRELAQTTTHIEPDLVDWKKQVTETVDTLVKLQGGTDAPPGIEQALLLLQQGKTEAAEVILREEATRKERDIKKDTREAAAAYWDLGALFYLTDPHKALTAYLRAIELEPDNASGLSRLGHLFRRTGELDKAEMVYRKLEMIGRATGDHSTSALAYDNLGFIYQAWGDLEEAEVMYRKSLEIEEALGRKEGMAQQYGNLGIVYWTRGDLDQAEAMYRKSLEIEETLGRREGVASDYRNLGIIYRTRGDLERAEAMYRKSLDLFKQIGLQPGIERAKELLEELQRN